jgi:two-component system phosphate regulon sensor histidine kinase PhoR
VFDYWFKASMPVIFGAMIALLIWIIFSVVPALLFMLAVLLFLMARHASHLFKLSRWLVKPDLQTIPEASGIWDEAFSRLYKMAKRHQQTKLDLAAELHHIEMSTRAIASNGATRSLNSTSV